MLILLTHQSRFRHLLQVYNFVNTVPYNNKSTITNVVINVSKEKKVVVGRSLVALGEAHVPELGALIGVQGHHNPTLQVPKMTTI